MCPLSEGRSISGPFSHSAEVAEWHTRRFQKPIPVREWGFESPLRHFSRGASRLHEGALWLHAQQQGDEYVHVCFVHGSVPGKFTGTKGGCGRALAEERIHHSLNVQPVDLSVI